MKPLVLALIIILFGCSHVETVRHRDEPLPRESSFCVGEFQRLDASFDSFQSARFRQAFIFSLRQAGLAVVPCSGQSPRLSGFISETMSGPVESRHLHYMVEIQCTDEGGYVGSARVTGRGSLRDADTLRYAARRIAESISDFMVRQ